MHSARPIGKNAVAFVFITVLLDVMSFGLIIPVLPTLLQTLTGEGVSRVAVYAGWLAFAYAGMQFLFAPVLGNLSDRFGRRPVLLFAIGALGVDYLIMGFAPTLAWLFFGRLLAGIAGASMTPAYAYVADVSPMDERAQNFGILSAAFGVGFIIGPALGGLIGELGPRAPFFAAAAASLTNFFYGWTILPESLPPEKRRPFSWRRANPLGTLLQMRKHPEHLGLFAALALWMVAHQVMPATWSFYTKLRFDWSESLIGASLATAGLVMAASQLTLIRFAVPRIGERRSALIGILFGALGYVGFGLSTEGWMMYAWLATWYFAAVVMPSTNGYMSRRIDAGAQGELQGAIACLFSLSSILGPPLMAQLFARFSAADAAVRLPGAAFFAAAALTLGCFAIYLTVTWRRPD